MAYGTDAQTVRKTESPKPAKTARSLTPTEILTRTRVSLGWLTWWVARGEIDPHDAAWAMCPTDNLSSGFIKLIGHTERVFREWASFHAEFGYDQSKDAAVRQAVMRIWGLKRERPCRLLQKN